MLFAKVVDLDCGYDHGKYPREKGLRVGDVFEVAAVHMSATYTTIVDEAENRFNSVHFEFFLDRECTKPHDIYNDPLYNPYVPGGQYNG